MFGFAAKQVDTGANLQPPDTLAGLKSERAAIAAAIARLEGQRARLSEAEEAGRAAEGRVAAIGGLEATELQAWVENGAVGPRPAPHAAERGEAEGEIAAARAAKPFAWPNPRRILGQLGFCTFPAFWACASRGLSIGRQS